MRAVPALLVVLGLLQAGQGGWIYAKAWLADVLLDSAWSRISHGSSKVKPWPWADTWPVARISLPGNRSGTVVLEGASGRVLAFAPGHLHGSASPGDEGACVVAGHRDTHFAALEHLNPGDQIELETPNGLRQVYEVRGGAVVDQNDTWALESTGGTELILVTCWPFDAIIPGGSDRYVVWADKLDGEP